MRTNPYQTASENHHNKQDIMSLIITLLSLLKIKLNMFISLPITEIDYLTERVIRNDVIQKFILNMLLL